jgi:hypothetical protein
MQRQELPFIPNVIGRQACRFIGKIRMRLAASGSPAAVKRRAVEPVSKVKILLALAQKKLFLYLKKYNLILK